MLKQGKILLILLNKTAERSKSGLQKFQNNRNIKIQKAKMTKTSKQQEYRNTKKCDTNRILN